MRFVALVAALVASGGCYSEPRPACGFVCGEGGACPSGYTCNDADRRCHRDGTNVDCLSFVDAAAPDGPDTTPPMVATSPANGDTNVALNATVKASFSEAVRNVDSTSFSLSWSRGPIVGMIDVQVGTPFVATDTPDVPFPGSTQITATLSASITDLTGNPLAETTWTFTTEPDTVAPVVTTTDPTAGSTNIIVLTKIDVNFSKAVGSFSQTSITVDQGVTGTIALQGFAGLEFTPSAALTAATTYTVTVATDVADLSGNPLAAPFSFSFTTM